MRCTTVGCWLATLTLHGPTPAYDRRDKKGQSGTFPSDAWAFRPRGGGVSRSDGVGFPRRDKRIIVCDAMDSRLRGNDGVGGKVPFYGGVVFIPLCHPGA